MTPTEREQLIEECKIKYLDHMFGDGMEEEYVMEGFPEHKGLLNMTDDELLQGYGHYDPEVHDTPEKRAEAFRKELEEGEDDEG